MIVMVSAVAQPTSDTVAVAQELLKTQQAPSVLTNIRQQASSVLASIRDV